jgi:CDP-4-dehydro-6-deoxyglucose reductase
MPSDRHDTGARTRTACGLRRTAARAQAQCVHPLHHLVRLRNRPLIPASSGVEHTVPAPAEQDAAHVVEGIRRRTPSIVEIELRPVEAPLRFLPGQYVLFGDADHRLPVRSYSVANAPRPGGELTLLITEVPGGETSGWVHHRLRAGERVLVSGPYGSFVADEQSGAPALYLAGGSGLAPVRALAEAAVASGRPERATLFFSARTEADLMDVDVFRDWERGRPGFRFLRTLTRAGGEPPLGRIPSLLPELFRDLAGHDVFVAGAPGFVDACADVARACGVRAGHLYTEAFFEEPKPWHGDVP